MDKKSILWKDDDKKYYLMILKKTETEQSGNVSKQLFNIFKTSNPYRIAQKERRRRKKLKKFAFFCNEMTKK